MTNPMRGLRDSSRPARLPWTRSTSVSLCLSLWLSLPAPVLAFSAATYFPLPDGGTWTYTNDLSASVVSGTTTINGVVTKQVLDNFNDAVFYSNDSAGLRLHRAISTDAQSGGTTTFRPPVDLALAQFNVGDELDSQGEVDFTAPGLPASVLNYTATTSVVGTEQVTVPAGTFDTVKIVATQHIFGSVGGFPLDITNTSTLWIADGIGIVKEDEGPPSNNVYELVSTNVGGGGGCNAVNGTAAADNLEGTADDDCINGKAAPDTMYGLGGNDTYTVDNTGDTVIEGAGEGTDTIKSSVTYTLPAYTEKLILTGTSAINGTGNGLANTLTGNSANNTLNGKAGADTMSGKAGNDAYYVDNTGDKVVEGLNQGTDTVRSTITHTLRSNVEKLILTGTGAINGNGNTLANTITGNGANNTLNGKGGNDTLKGGAGKNRFLFNTALGSGNVDRITDFDPADDTIRLENAVFTALTTTGTLPPAAFRIGGSATTPAHRILYNSTNGAVFYDADGMGGTPAVRFATLPTGLALTNADFYVQ